MSTFSVLSNVTRPSPASRSSSEPSPVKKLVSAFAVSAPSTLIVTTSESAPELIVNAFAIVTVPAIDNSSKSEPSPVEMLTMSEKFNVVPSKMLISTRSSSSPVSTVKFFGANVPKAPSTLICK